LATTWDAADNNHKKCEAGAGEKFPDHRARSSVIALGDVMTNVSKVVCPNCGAEIPLDAVYRERLRHEAEALAEPLLVQAKAAGRNESNLEIKYLKEQLAEQEDKRIAAESKEFELLKEQQAVAEQKRGIELEVARRVAEQAAARQNQQNLREKEQEKKIASLQEALKEAERVAFEGPPHRHGEILEVEVEGELRRMFPLDDIVPVPNGQRGADVEDRVRDRQMRDCGLILVETKNTKHWYPSWIDKAKEDQCAKGAGAVLIISAVLPPGIDDVGFGEIDGVWVSGLRTWPGVAVMLHELTIQLAAAHAIDGEREQDRLLRYFKGEGGKHRAAAMIDCIRKLQSNHTRKLAAFHRLWNEERKQLMQLTINTAGMIGDIRGIIGSNVLSIPALEFDAGAGHEGETPDDEDASPNDT
jgi:hypothetical protein